MVKALAAIALREGTRLGYSIFSVGDIVRVTGGSFVGIEGKVVAALNAARSSGTVMPAGASLLMPVTVSTILDGHEVSLRVPPNLLQRIA